MDVPVKAKPTRRRTVVPGDQSSPAPSVSLVPANGNLGSELAHIDGVPATVMSPEEEEQILESISNTDIQRIYLSNESEGRHNYQQSLGLFSSGAPIGEIKQELLLKKASHHFRYKNPFKLLQSKIYNAMIFIARPKIMSEEVFSVSLDYLSWIVDYNSGDLVYLKESISEMQQTLLQIPAGTRWFSTQLINEVLIDGNTLYFKVPNFVRKLNAAPDRYYYISMRLNAMWKSKHALAMYELLQEHQWKGETGYLPVTELRERLGIEDKEYPEFKRLSAKVIQPALAEIEEMTDISGTPQYGREKRFVTSVNFVITANPKRLDVEAAYLDPGRYKELREEFGLKQKQVTEITKSFSTDRIEAVADVLFYRYIVNSPKHPVKNWFALFKNALKDTEDNYILTNSEKADLVHQRERRHQAAQLAETRRRQAEVEQRQADNRKNISNKLDVFWSALDLETRQQLWDDFLASPEGKPIKQARRIRAGSKPDVQHPLARASVTGFLHRIGKL